MTEDYARFCRGLLSPESFGLNAGINKLPCCTIIYLFLSGKIGPYKKDGDANVIVERTQNKYNNRVYSGNR